VTSLQAAIHACPSGLGNGGRLLGE
jgi:hypothetical protein